MVKKEEIQSISERIKKIHDLLKIDHIRECFDKKKKEISDPHFWKKKNLKIL